MVCISLKMKKKKRTDSTLNAVALQDHFSRMLSLNVPKMKTKISKEVSHSEWICDRCSFINKNCSMCKVCSYKYQDEDLVLTLAQKRGLVISFFFK